MLQSHTVKTFLFNSASEHWTLVITRFNIRGFGYNTVEVMDPDFSKTDQSCISVNRTHMYMYAVVRLTK